MRVKIIFSGNNKPYPLTDSYDIMNSYIHKCLGKNNPYHDAPNNYNISSIQGGKLNEDKKTLNFPNGGFIVVSSYDNEFIDILLNGIQNNVDLGYGMKYERLEVISEYFYNGWNHFVTLSPFVLFKPQHRDVKKSYYTIKDEDLAQALENHIKNKFSKIDKKLDLSDLKVQIKNHDSHKVKSILLSNNVNRANQCHVSIYTNKKLASAIYHYGLGQSCGAGFGCVYKTETKEFYR